MGRRRYVAERHEIAARYAEWEIIGPPEIRDVDPNVGYFNPTRGTRTVRASACNVVAVLAVTRLPVEQRPRVVVVGVAG